ncbi:MAG: tetratricopeptide repeat protein [Elusimicrobia bacterium]|nr:tetratricopeptide repeat protein [Elusimicrobiota bacterium]
MGIAGTLFLLGILAAPSARGAGPDTAALFEQANKLFEARRHEQAIALFLKVAEDPSEGYAANALLMAGVNYDWLAAERKDPALFEEERKVLGRLIAEYPDSSRTADAYLYLGQVFSGHTLGIAPARIDCTRAIKMYEQAAARADREWIKAQAKGRIGQCLDMMGRPAEALTAYREVMKLYPNTPWGSQEIPDLLRRRH